MKKLFGAILIAGLLVISMVTITRALLQDVEYVTGNKVIGATVNLQVGDNDPSTVSFIFNKVKPGEEREFSVPIASVGGYIGNFWYELNTSNSIEGENPESETETTGEGELDDCAEVFVNFENTDNGQVASSLDWTTVNQVGNQEQFWGNSPDAWVGTGVAQFNLKLRTDACESDSMGDGFDLDLVFHLEEVPSQN